MPTTPFAPTIDVDGAQLPARATLLAAIDDAWSRLARPGILATQTDSRCHFHTLRAPSLHFHRAVRCNHSHGRHPDVRYTGGV